MRIHEITQIEDFLDKDYSNQLLRRYEENRDKLQYLQHLSSHELWGNKWPLSTTSINRFYLIDEWGDPVAEALFRNYQGRIFRPTHIFILPNSQKKGLGSSLYSFLLDKGYSLISDTDQTQASKKLWASLFGKYELYLVKNDKKKKITDKSEIEQAYQPGYLLLASKKK